MHTETPKTSPPTFSFLIEHLTLARAGVGTLCLASLLFCLPVPGQVGTPSSAPVPSQPEIAEDALGRTNPRGTVLGFLIAARDGNNELAAQYLNTRLRGDAAADLAHKLYVVLDRRLPARYHLLRDTPEGSLSDPLRPNQELLGEIISDNGNNVDIIVERVTRGKSLPLWLFSSKTLDGIPDLYEEIGGTPVENILPAFLVNTRFAGIVLFQWLAICVGLPLFFILTALLNRLFSPIIGAWCRRLTKETDLPDPHVLPIAVRLLLLAAVIRWLLSKLGLPLLARQFWLSAAGILTITGCVWVLIYLNYWVERYLAGHVTGGILPGTRMMLRFVRRVADLLIVVVGLLVTLYHFGVNPTAALAGLGVGGIAVALAAQKTLENVIGGVSLIFDRAVQVGDFLKVGDTTGTIDDVGFRSTRIRTLDRTMVSVPNGQVANLVLESYSARDKFWFHPILNLHRSTTSPQMQAVLESIRSLLRENQSVETNSIRVRFIRLGLYSLDVEVFAYIKARDWNEFLELQEPLLLDVLKSIESAGVQIALPSQSVFLATKSPSTGPEIEATSTAPAQFKKTKLLSSLQSG